VNTRRSITVLIALCVIAISTISAQGQDYPIAKIKALIDNAEPNALILVPPGVYNGHLKITKPVVLDGQGKATIDGGGEGVVIKLLVPDITIRGFTIRGSGSGVNHEPSGILTNAGPVIIENNRFVDVLFGIDMRQSPDSIIRNNTIHGKDLDLGRRGDGIRLWWSHNAIVENNTVDGLRDMVFWYSENLKILDNKVSNSRYGLHFMYSHHTLLADNELNGNSVGIYLMYSNSISMINNNIINNRGSSGYGIGLKDCDNITVENNALLANRVGIYLDNSPSSYDSTGIVKDNKIAFNEIGLLATPITHNNVITHNAFVENEEQVTAHGGGQLSKNEFSQDGVGNFWSNYAGYDADNDGVGDLPYAPRSLFMTLLAREPNLRLFVHSPAQQAIELTARAFPDLSPKPIFTDPVPLSRPPKLDLLVSSNPTSSTPMFLLAAGLIFGAGVGGWMIARQHPLPTISSPTPLKPKGAPA